MTFRVKVTRSAEEQIEAVYVWFLFWWQGFALNTLRMRLLPPVFKKQCRRQEPPNSQFPFGDGLVGEDGLVEGEEELVLGGEVEELAV